MVARVETTEIECVNCGERISLSGKVELGQVVRCDECATPMEVLSLSPVEVDWAYQEPVYVDDDEEAW
jgi:lysine biosynthesis protein LysW